MKTFTEVAGITVIAQEPARMTRQPGQIGAGETQTLSTVAELLLANEQTVYGCIHPAPHARNCIYTAPTPRSVISHQRLHSAKVRERRSYANRVAGAQRAAETKKQKLLAASENLAKEPTPELTAKPVSPAAQLGLTMDAIALGLQQEATKLRGIATQLDWISRNLPSPPKANVDPAELERLRKIEKNYETLKGLLSQ